MKALSTTAAMLLFAVGLGACAEDEPEAPVLSDAENCDTAYKDQNPNITLVLESESLTLRAPAPVGIEEELGLVLAVECVVDNLDGPSGLGDKIGATNAFAGQQTDSWDRFAATWSYSGNNGLVLIVEED